ncbi:centrosomal protein of 162 kDa-like isoform X2 [Rhincodon typus]|uniref:centrosomal protein of 162 kDa-like isoform X2 n=1 Tax=Rhincodon typus TaxID=259920 RepID=UPI002030CCCB|nr:centrosomal protein of 162 kDa-like isoform X2 [Rhincodon typus]
MSQKLTKEEIEKQFEQFLKESISDESVDLGNSPKSSVLSSLGKHTRKEIKKDAKPWWINDDDSDEGNVLGINRSFLKSQRFSQSIAEVEEEQNQEKERERISVSISQDSLERNDSVMASGPRQSTPGIGLDTLEEEEEKVKFFANLEKGATSTIDYSQLNKELESTDSIPLATMNQNEDRLQVLEIEETKEDESRLKSTTASRHYSDDFDDYSDAKFGSEGIGLDDNILKTECSPETVKETKEQDAEPGMLAKVVLLDSLDSTLDAQKLEDDQSMIKPTTEENPGQQGQASQMYTTSISYEQTNSDIEALHQAYCDIDQSLEATDVVQSIRNRKIINFVQDLQSPVTNLTRNVSMGESDLLTVEELMKPIKAGDLVPGGYDSHSISKNAQQDCEATEIFRKRLAKDTYSAVPSELQLDSNHLSGRQSTYKELPEKLFKENESCMSRICDEDVEALSNEVKYDPAIKRNVSVSTSQNVPHQDDRISSKTRSPKVKIKPFGGSYAFVKSSGYGKMSQSKKESFGDGEKQTHQSPQKQTASIKSFKARSPSEHTKNKSKGQLHATQTIRPAKHRFNENDLGRPLFTSVQSFTLNHQHQINSKTDHAKLLGVHTQDQLHSLETNRKKLIFGGPLDPVTEEKLKLIEKEVQEQETLIQGYHKVLEQRCWVLCFLNTVSVFCLGC